MNRIKYTNTVSRRTVLGSVGTAASFALWASELQDAKALAANTIQWPALHLVNGPDLKSGEWAGLPAIVVFWETWCPYCKRHNSRVEQLYQATLGKNVRVMGATTEADEAKVKAYVASSELHFPVAMVPPDFRAQVTKRKVIPLTCLVSAAGTLLQVIPGEMTQEDVLALAAQVMGSSPKISSN